MIRASVRGAPRKAVGVGKSIVNSPLFKSAVCGNPNVGRLASAIGKFFGWIGYDGSAQSDIAADFNPHSCRISIGGVPIFQDGQFTLDLDSEMAVAQHMKDAQLYESSPAVDPETGYVTYPASVSWPRHKRYVDIDVDLGMVSSHQGDGVVRVSGASLTHEYVSENADYRS